MLSTLALMGAFCSAWVMGAQHALAGPLTVRPLAMSRPSLPGAGGLGALVLGSFSLAMTRRILRG